MDGIMFVATALLGIAVGGVFLVVCGMGSRIERIEKLVSTIASLKEEVEKNGTSNEKK